MIQKILKLSTAILLCLSTMSLQAQEAVPATGGEASGSGGLASYTTGQLVYTTLTGTTGSVAQGVQQPYEISIVTGIPEAENINIYISVYPNPTSDFLTLNTENYNPSTLKFQLFDINGKLLKCKKITADKTKIATNDLTPGTYFLNLRNNKRIIKSFKIIKN